MQNNLNPMSPRPDLRDLLANLHPLIGLYRKMLEVVRAERAALAEADLKAIQDTTAAKQAMIDELAQAEIARARLVAQISPAYNKKQQTLTLQQLIVAIQGFDQKLAESFRVTHSALSLLIKRVQEQNTYNQTLVARSLDHVQQVNMNLLGGGPSRSDTYGAKGARVSTPGGARLLSREV